jgi:hypothetical protein
MNDEVSNYISNLQTELHNKQTNIDVLNRQVSMFGTDANQNLVQFQLELDSVIERIDHMLRGDELVFDENSNLVWKRQVNTDLMLLNESGIQEILRILQVYLNRNTILSNYDLPTINYKLFDLGNALNDLIYTKYEGMGLDNNDKRKHYEMIVRQIVDIIHSAYLRAYNGLERDSLKTSRVVTQTEALGQSSMMGYNAIKPNNRSLLKPWTWGNK